MQKNWYVIYTRTQCEKKVAALLSRRKVENFIPYVHADMPRSKRSKSVSKPLFKSYVFVYASEGDLSTLRTVEGVISILYWLGKPAVITDAEINAIKEFTTDYQDVNLEKLSVKNQAMEKSFYKSAYTLDSNLIAIKNQTIKINLPSLGYAMVANLKEESIFGLDKTMSGNYSFAQS